MEENEYERLDGAGVVVSTVAGAFAGTAEHVVMYPVDSVKTRMQALKCEKKLSKGIFSNVFTMMREEGALRPMRGATVVVLGSAPAHALYFTGYEQIKKLFSHKKLRYLPESVGHGAAGAVATLFHDAIMTPAEAVKQRMQMCCSKYTRWTHCAKHMYREEGGRAFFRAYTTQLSMNIPFQVCQFTVYEYSKKILNPEGKYDPKSHLLSGAVAGAVAAAITNPLDVCKTLLNTQEPQLLRELNTTRIVGMPAALRTIYSVAGFPGFFKGLTARMLFQAPSTAICWCTYEALKHLLSLQSVTSSGGYDTLADITGGVGGSQASVGDKAAAAAGKGVEKERLWETITDLPRPLQALEAWSEQQQPGSPLQFRDTPTIQPFAGLRTD